jgi:hypothetical protein
LAAIPLHEMRFEKGLGQALHGVHGANLQLESQDEQNQQISPDSCKFFKGQVPEFSECYSHGLKTVVDESHSNNGTKRGTMVGMPLTTGSADLLTVSLQPAPHASSRLFWLFLD